MSGQKPDMGKNGEVNYGLIFDNIDSAVVAARARKKADIMDVRVAYLPQGKFTIVYVSGYSAGGVVVDSDQGNGKPFYLPESRIVRPPTCLCWQTKECAEVNHCEGA